MNLTLKIWIAALVLCVGTLPHSVGAMFSRTQIIILEMGTSCQPTLTYMKKSAKDLARDKVLSMYKSNWEWKSLLQLWTKESRWDYTADNPKSSAFGIPQLLNLDENTSMRDQIDLGLKYIQHRYGTPSRALAFHNKHGWY